MTPRFRESSSVQRRLVVTGALELTSPCHLGGRDADATSEQPILRDNKGSPYLPGTTLAGLLRGALGELDRAQANVLFGGEVGDEEGYPSALMIDDAPSTLGVQTPTELRDGVKINQETGTADDKAKFDVELLPPGTRFSLSFELALGDSTQPALEGLVRVMDLLERGEIQLGARTRRGFGACKAFGWSLTDYDTSTKEGMLAWISRGLCQTPEGWATCNAEPMRDAAALAKRLGASIPESASLQKKFSVRLTLDIDGSILIRSGGHDPREPDATHLHRLAVEGEKQTQAPVISGTSLAGALRHRCLRIAKTLEREDAEDLINTMFGRVERASKVRVAEALIEGGRPLRHTRVRIDPWTGGALESFLFTEDAWYGGTVTLDVALVHPERAHRALLLLALRDLATGDLPIGGESGVGRGRLRAKSSAPFATCDGEGKSASLFLEEGGAVRVEPQGAFDQDFESLSGRAS